MGGGQSVASTTTTAEISGKDQAATNPRSSGASRQQTSGTALTRYRLASALVMPLRHACSPQQQSYPPTNALAGEGASAVCRRYHRCWLPYKLPQPGCGAIIKLLADFRMSHQLMMVDFSSYIAAAPVSPDSVPALCSSSSSR